MDQDGQSIVLCLAFPGLSDSLGLKNYEPTEDIDLPDYVEITADAKNFSLDFTATILSSGLLSDLEDDDLKDADDLTESMEKLTDASSKLVDGTDELASGTFADAKLLRRIYQWHGCTEQWSTRAEYSCWHTGYKRIQN